MAKMQFIEKSILVRELVDEVESVLNRYAKKGWEAVSYVRCEGPPESVRITLRKPKV